MIIRSNERQHKDSGSRYEKSVQDAEFAMEKAKSRFDSTAEELERILVTKEGESIKDASEYRRRGRVVMWCCCWYWFQSTPDGISGSGKEAKRGGIGKAMSKGLFKAKNPAQIQRQEDETRARMNSASEQFKKAVQDNQATKQEFFNLQLPKILRVRHAYFSDLGFSRLNTFFHIANEGMCGRARYGLSVPHGKIRLSVWNDVAGRRVCSFACFRRVGYVSTLSACQKCYADGFRVDIGEKAGLKAIVETIDNRNDFKTFMQNFTVARGSQRGPSRNVPYDDGSVSLAFLVSQRFPADLSLLLTVTGDASPRTCFALWSSTAVTTTISAVFAILPTKSLWSDIFRVQQWRIYSFA
jgi:hypothetical protein